MNSNRLIRTAAAYDRIVVMTHDNPDPDAIASGWALVRLLEEKAGRPCLLTGGGEIIRAENRKMVSLLQPPLKLNAPMGLDEKTLLILVDCDIDTTNHPRIDTLRVPVAVIDHHSRKLPPEGRTVFEDRRPGISATSTIAAGYLKEQGLTPPPELATALVYGIRTETKAGQTDYSPLDHEMLTWLVGLGNPSYLARIEDAPLSLAYFSDLALALQSTFLYDDSAFCILPQIQGPEVVGEVADLLVRCERIRNVLCGAIHHGNFIVSVRTEDKDRHAASLVVQLLKGMGHGGGHAHRAGGMIEQVGEGPEVSHKLFRALRRRWLMACARGGTRGKRLVSRAIIMRHL